MLRADRASDGNRWIRGLTLQIDLIQGGTFQGPPSNKNRRRGATVVRTGNVSGVVEIGRGSEGINIGSGGESTPPSPMGQQEGEGVSGGKWRWSGKIVPVNSPRSRAGRSGCDVERRGETHGPAGGEGEDNQRWSRKEEDNRASQNLKQKHPPLPRGPPPSHGRNGSSRLRSSKSASASSSEGNTFMFRCDMDGNHRKACHDEGREGRQVDGERERERKQQREEGSCSVVDSPQRQRGDGGEEEEDCDEREGMADSRDNWRRGRQCSEARRSVGSPKSGSIGSCRRRKRHQRHQQQKTLYDDVGGANSSSDGRQDNTYVLAPSDSHAVESQY